MTRLASRILTVALVTLIPTALQAQTPKLEFAVGTILEGPSSAGTTRAELLDPAGNPVTLFEATHRTTAAVGLAGGVSYRIRPRFALELSGVWTRPDFESKISDDFEGAADTTLALGMHRFSVELSAVRHFGRRGALEPYARIGAGWLRELTRDRTLVDDGVAAHVGGGLKYWLREGRPGWLGDIALRADVRLAIRRGGIALGDAGTRWSPDVVAGLVIAR
jgi:hypothetical protein